MNRPPLLVLLTVDTEIWPFTPHWRESGLEEETRRYIDGVTPDGSFGLAYQMERLNRHGLKAVFFVEALFACEMGLEPLRRIVSMIAERGHDVELHTHTEWLKRMSRPLLPGRTGSNMKDFSEEEQSVLIAQGLRNLRDSGATNVRAFRAGNFGANFDTLRALARNGIPCDTSYNESHLTRDCALRTPLPLLQPVRLEGVCEVPVTTFQDFPGHVRPVQLCAASSSEVENALDRAWERGWRCVVWVSHSFELLKRRIRPGHASLPDRIAIGRFDRMCEFLAAHRDRFVTAGFGDIDLDQAAAPSAGARIQSGVARTARRMAEQALSQIL